MLNYPCILCKPVLTVWNHAARAVRAVRASVQSVLDQAAP